MLRRSVLGLVLAFGVGCATASGGAHPDAVRHNDQGAQLLSQGSTEDAEARFVLALEFTPDFAEAWANLGIVALTRGGLDKAEEHLQHAVRINRDFAEAWSSLGVVYERQDRREKAVEAYGRALSIQPGLVDPRRNLAVLFINNGANRSRFVRVKLIGSRSNRDGVGARVTVTRPDGGQQWRLVHSGSSYCSQSDIALTFGLGENHRAESIEVVWPSGEVDRVGPVVANQVAFIKEGQGLLSSRVLPPRGTPLTP